MAIEKNKQYSSMLPSRHITREKEEELRMGSSLAGAKGLADLKRRVQNRNSYGQDVTAILHEEDEKELDAEIVMNVVEHLVDEERKEEGKLLRPNVKREHDESVTRTQTEMGSRSLMSDLDDVLAVDDSANEDDVDETNDFESDKKGTEQAQHKGAADESALTRFFTGMLK